MPQIRTHTRRLTPIPPQVKHAFDPAFIRGNWQRYYDDAVRAGLKGRNAEDYASFMRTKHPGRKFEGGTSDKLGSGFDWLRLFMEGKEFDRASPYNRKILISINPAYEGI